MRRLVADSADVTGVELDDDTVVGCRTVLVGIGAAPEDHEVPWFWPDQFDLKLRGIAAQAE